MTPSCQFRKNAYALQKILEMCSTLEYGKMRITKEARAAREDKRDIMPDCIIEVGPSSKSK